MGGVEDDGATGFFHHRQRAHVGDEVVVAKAHAAFTQHDAVIAGAFRFVGDVAHVPRCEELAFFDVDRQALGADVVDEVGLAAEEGRGLQYVHHGGDFIQRGVFVHVGKNGDADLGFDFGEDAQTFGDTGTTIAGAGRAVGFVEGGFVDEGDAEIVSDFFQGFRR